MRTWMVGSLGVIAVALVASASYATPHFDYELPIEVTENAPQHLRLHIPSMWQEEGDGDGASEGSAEVEKKKRETFHQLDARYRRLSFPDAILDSFYDVHEHVSGQAVGADYTAVKASGFNIIISADYSEVSAPDGPWQERGETDIDWTQLSLFFISGDLTVAYELNLPGGLSLLFGTGIGFGVVGGDIVTFDDETGPTGERIEESYPPIMPVVNVQVSPRLVIINKLVLQADVGFRNALYGGLSVGLRI